MFTGFYKDELLKFEIYKAVLISVVCFLYRLLFEAMKLLDKAIPLWVSACTFISRVKEWMSAICVSYKDSYHISVREIRIDNKERFRQLVETHLSVLQHF